MTIIISWIVGNTVIHERGHIRMEGTRAVESSTVKPLENLITFLNKFKVGNIFYLEEMDLVSRIALICVVVQSTDPPSLNRNDYQL